MGLGLRFVDLDPLRPAALGELGGEAALAEPGFGNDPDHVALPRLGRLERLLERLQLRLAADESREAALAREVEPGSGEPTPPSSKTPTGRLEPLISNSPRSSSSR